MRPKDRQKRLICPMIGSLHRRVSELDILGGKSPSEKLSPQRVRQTRNASSQPEDRCPGRWGKLLEHLGRQPTPSVLRKGLHSFSQEVLARVVNSILHGNSVQGQMQLSLEGAEGKMARRTFGRLRNVALTRRVRYWRGLVHSLCHTQATGAHC
jgi:hypothetical protein